MAGYAALRDAIVTQLETVANIGDVHNYERLVTRREEADTAFKAAIGADAMIQFADVSLLRIDYRLSASASATTWRYEALTTFRVRIFRSWNDADASGRLFAVVLEAALQAVVTAMSALTPRLARIEAQVTANEARMFGYPGVGDVLSHYGELIVSCPDQIVV